MENLTLENIISDLNDRIYRKEPIDSYLVIETALTLSVSLNRLRDWFNEKDLMCPADFNGTIKMIKRNNKISAVLGGVPENCDQFVDLYVAHEGLKLTISKFLKSTSDKKTDMNGKPVNETELENLNAEEAAMFRSLFQLTSNKEYNLQYLKETLARLSSNVGLGYSDNIIEYSINEWVRKERQKLIVETWMTLRFDKHAKTRGNNEYARIVENYFDIDAGMTRDFIIAVIRNFIYQVKRKAFNLPVEFHLMPVIIGEKQGSGKSWFAKGLLSVIDGLWASVDFKMIEDDRNIDLWENNALLFDEMGWAATSNMEKIKHYITTEMLSRRPMRSNTESRFKQSAMFIGTSNKEIDEILTDNGMRRFVGLPYRAAPSRIEVNWQLLWQSVDENDVSPIKPFIEVLTYHQKALETPSEVEQWLLDPERDDFRKLSDDEIHKNVWYPDQFKQAQLLYIENFMPWWNNMHSKDRSNMTDKKFYKQMRNFYNSKIKNIGILHQTTPNNKLLWKCTLQDLPNTTPVPTKKRGLLLLRD